MNNKNKKVKKNENKTENENTEKTMKFVCTNDDDDEEKIFEVPERYIVLNATLENLIKDTDEIEEGFPVVGVAGPEFEKVIEYCTKFVDDRNALSHPNNNNADNKSGELTPWEIEFCDMTIHDLFNLLIAANWLDNQPLILLLVRAAANHVRGNTPAENREKFNLTDEFQEGELDKIEKANEWCKPPFS